MTLPIAAVKVYKLALDASSLTETPFQVNTPSALGGPKMLTSKFSTLTGLFFGSLIVLGSLDSIAGQKLFGAKDVETMPPVVMQLSPCAKGKESGLPLPSTFLPNRLPDFQAQVKEFLVSGRYKNLTWCEDEGLRDTGPFVNGVS